MGIIRTSAIALGITLVLAGPANGGTKKPENNLAGNDLRVAQASDSTKLAIEYILNK